MTNTSPFQLVTTYNERIYPYWVSYNIDDPLNSTAVQTAELIMKGAVNITGMPDYKIFTTWSKVTAHLPTQQDREDCLRALSPVEKLYSIFSYNSSLPANEILHRCKTVEIKLNEMFAGDIKVRAKTGGNIIVLSGYKSSYFAAKRMDPMTLIFGAEPH